MQQAATRAQQVPSSAADGEAAPGVLRSAFVINLISSTSPVALNRPEHAGLKRFNFFVSRRREEGRERFRLHMGYFDTQEEAEKLLDIVREIYPGAWAGLAPGRGLRGTPPVPQPDPEAHAAPRSVATGAASAPQPSAPSRRVNARDPAPGAAQLSSSTRAMRPDARPIAPAATTPDRRARVAGEQLAAAQPFGNVRSAIDALEDSAGVAAAAPALPAKPRVVPTLRPAHSIPTLKPTALPAPDARAPATPAPKTAARPESSGGELADRSVLKLLEGSAGSTRMAPSAPPMSEKPCFAVQLAWSVEPIDLTRVPQLAIFNSYTLYGAQGHREGRRWYGLRLGFFTDAVSAKQVAQYVRSDFATVSVVPVSTRERDQAKRAIGGVAAPNPASVVPVAGAARPARATASATVSLDEFKFIDDAADSLPAIPPRKGREPRGAGASATASPGRSGRGAPGKRAVFRAGRVHAARKTKQMTLEETLEILGANDLEVDARKKRTADGVEASAPATAPSGKPSKLSRLFERLSERLGT